MTKYMKSKWLPRRYPEAILVEESSIIGPFCSHCGAPHDRHSPKGEFCPSTTNGMWPLPNCGCHAVASEAPKPGTTIEVWNYTGRHRVVVSADATRADDV